MKKTQKEIGSVYLELKGLDHKRFLSLIKDHSSVFRKTVSDLKRGDYDFVENYKNDWCRVSRISPKCKMVTLDELEEIIKGTKPLFMRDLDKSKVYGLSDLSDDEAKALLDWLLMNDSGWSSIYIGGLKTKKSILHQGGTWVLSSKNYDEMIKDLFKPLEDTKPQRTKEVIEKEIKALQDELKELEAPIKGDYVITAKGIIGIVTSVDRDHRTGFPYEINGEFRTRKPEKINPELTIAQFIAMQKINGGGK